MSQTLARYSKILEIVGDIIKVQVPKSAGEKGAVARYGDLAVVEDVSRRQSLAQVINANRDVVGLQVFSGTKGLSTSASVRFLNHPMRVTYSPNILGRVFR
jgi:V/A-type H+-transporting ATPase subunit B